MAMRGDGVSDSPNWLTFSCPRCKVVLRVDPARAGETIRCEHCNSELVVPGTRPAPDEFFGDLFELEPADPAAGSSASQAATATRAGAPKLPADIISELPRDPADEPPAQDFELLPQPTAIGDAPSPSSRLAQAGADPFAEDDDAPIRLEGIGMVDPHERMLHVRCPVCDSVMLAAATEVGTQIQCTDCHSLVTVNRESPETAPIQGRAQNPSEIADAWMTRDLSAFPDLGPGVTEPAALSTEQEYVLAPLSDDHLRPRVPLELLAENVAPTGSPTMPATRVPATTVPATRVAAGPARNVESSRTESRSPSSTQSGAKPGALPTAGASAERRSEYDHRLSDSVDAYEQEMRSRLENNEPVDESQLFRFPGQFLAPFRDPTVWIYVLLLTLILWANQGLFGLAAHLNGLSENGVQVYGAIGLLMYIMGIGVGLLFTIVAGVVINQLVEAAAYKRDVFHPPEMGILPWLTSFSVVGVSLWAASLVGAVFGTLVASITRAAWPGWAVGSAVVFFLLPIGILSAYYNGSPIKIFSPVVISTIRTHRAGWLRFYRWMGAWLLLTVAANLFLFVPGIGSLLVACTWAVTVILVGRTIGLLGQAFTINWINEDE